MTAKPNHSKKKAPGKHARKKPDLMDDLFLEEDLPRKIKHKPAPHSRLARRRKQRRKSRAKKTAYGSVSALLAVVCLLLIGLGALATRQYFDFLEIRAYLDRETFYPGVVVDGEDLSGCTLPEAIEAFREKELALAAQRDLTFVLDGAEYAYDSLSLGYSSNFEAVLQGAWKIGRTGGNLHERYEQALAGCNYEISRGFDETMLRQATYNLAASFTKESVSAEIADFTHNTGKFTFTQEQNGVFVDSEELYRSANAALEAGESSVEIVAHVVAPEVTAEQLAAQYGEMSSAVTNASSSNDNRISNIRLACAAINVCLQPGEEFSFNETVGERTKEAGYKKAGVYISGELGEEIGGGICQVSTTLFNAVVKADLEITERHNHSLPVSYVDNGKDATVNWGSQDFKFVNSTDEPIYIVAFVTDDWRVRTHIFGKMRTDGITISLIPVVKDIISPGKEELRYVSDLAPGEMRLKSKARDGYRVNSYKAYTDADGNVIDKVFLCSSYYPPRAKVIEVGQ